jgi:hypothetical protein
MCKIHFPPQWLNKKKVTIKQEEFFKIRLLMMKTYDGCKHKGKLYLNSIKTNETNVEKEWEHLQNILKSAAYENLGKIQRQKKENV